MCRVHLLFISGSNTADYDGLGVRPAIEIHALDGETLKKHPFLAVALTGWAMLVCLPPTNGAKAGPIIVTQPPARSIDSTFAPDDDSNSPFIEFDLGSRNADSSFPAISDPTDEGTVPWIIQDRESLDWFGKRDDVLATGVNGTDSLQPNSTLDLDEPVITNSAATGLSPGAYPDTPRNFQDDNGLDATLTRLVAGTFKSLGYLKSMFVMVPILMIIAFVGLSRIAKFLRASQGLEAEKGKHRWGIQRSGQFGIVKEHNDNGPGSPDRKDVA